MKCPRCDFDGQIIKNKLVMKGDKLYRQLTYMCRNKQCTMFNKEIGQQEVEVPYDKEGENNDSKSES